jgi:thiosulfate/3-mercaptopyruvate sulfurtransferase
VSVSPSLPLVVEPEGIEGRLGEAGLLIVDLSKPEVYEELHVPGAVHVDYASLLAQRGPTRGLLPDDRSLSALFSALGLTPETHVVAYDEEGCVKAARFLWTLDVLGHAHFSLLNAGLQAWCAEGRPVAAEKPKRAPSEFRVPAEKRGIANAEYILTRLNDPGTAILDVREVNEYRGLVRSALRNGHIPGAVNLEWTFALDPSGTLRLKSREELEEMLRAHGVSPNKEVIVHCQTHHRSAHTYIVLKALGYPNVKGYPGSWSDWGNRSDTPVEGGAL